MSVSRDQLIFVLLTHLGMGITFIRNVSSVRGRFGTWNSFELRAQSATQRSVMTWFLSIKALEPS